MIKFTIEVNELKEGYVSVQHQVAVLDKDGKPTKEPVPDGENEIGLYIRQQITEMCKSIANVIRQNGDSMEILLTQPLRLPRKRSRMEKLI